MYSILSGLLWILICVKYTLSAITLNIPVSAGMLESDIYGNVSSVLSADAVSAAVALATSEPGIDQFDFYFPFEKVYSKSQEEFRGDMEDAMSFTEQQRIHVNVLPSSNLQNEMGIHDNFNKGLMDYFKGVFGSGERLSDDLKFSSHLKKRRRRSTEEVKRSRRCIRDAKRQRRCIGDEKRRRRSIGDAIVAALHLCDIHPELLNVSVQGIQFHCKIIRKY